jgi:uncharacterized membrane protein YqjE
MTTHREDGDPHERPIAELLKELSNETTTLVRQELELAKAEMAQKGQQAGKGAGMFGGAAVLGFLALALLAVTLIMAIDKGTANWVAALIVTVIYAGVAGILALQGRNKVREAGPPAPEQAVESAKEDVQWAKTRTQSARR